MRIPSMSIRSIAFTSPLLMARVNVIAFAYTMLESTAVTKKCLIGIARRTRSLPHQFQQHRTQEGELRQVRDGGSFSDCPDETAYPTAPAGKWDATTAPE